jgi:hypothetical protein
MTRDELLASIRRERAQLDAVVARVGEARMTEPALEGGRSVKDVLAHVSAWEKICMALVRNNQPIQPPPPGESGPSEPSGTEGQRQTDAINDKVYQDNRDRPLADVVADAQRSYTDLVAMVEAMSQEQLETPLGGPQFAGQSPRVGELIGGNSDGHYREHSEQIARWLGG